MSQCGGNVEGVLLVHLQYGGKLRLQIYVTVYQQILANVSG